MAENRGDSTAKNTYVIMICTFISRILGIVRISVISAIFGASGVADVINFTFNIPNNLRKLLAEGALSNAYIPVLSKSLIEDDQKHEDQSQLLVRNMLGLQLVIMVPLILGVFLFDEQIIRAISGFDEPGKIELSASLLSYFSLYLLLISIIAVVSSTLHCKSVFIITAVSPLSFSVAVILSLLVLGRNGNPYAFVIGVLIGGIIQFLILQPAFRRAGFSILPKFRSISPHMRQVAVYWVPVMVTSSIAVINQQVAFYLASGLQEGSVTAFNNSIIFWQLPYGLFFNAIATVYFPKMSRDFYAGDYRGLEDHMVRGLSQLMIFLIPSMFLLLSMSDEFVSAILLRGAYTLENTLLTAKTVRMYAIGLLSVAFYNFLLRFFYSIASYRITLISSAIVGILDIILSVTAVTLGYDVSALALANTVSFTVGSIFLSVYIILKTDFTIRIRFFFKELLKLSALSIPALLVSRIMPNLIGSWVGSGSSLYGLSLTVANSLIFGAVILVFYRIGNVDISWLRRR